MRVPILIAVLALASLVPADAGATTTFGTNLSRVPDDTVADCTTLPPYGVPTYVTTCTWYSTISAAENHIVPLGEGVITRARVRVGRTTGPMQFAVGRAQLDRNKPPGQQLLCCVWRIAGPVFTPAANAVTTVTLDEPVRQVRDFQSNQDLFDNLALSILRPGVPIPAARIVGAYAGACWPAVQAGAPYCMPGGPGSYAVLFNADWERARGGDILRLAREIAPVRNNVAWVPLICRLLRECAGLLALQNARAPQAAAAARKTVTYGRATFKITKGKRRTVKVTLTAAGRALLRSRRTAKVWANRTVTSGDGKRVGSTTLTLKR